jgi:hypothetical protein
MAEPQNSRPCKIRIAFDTFAGVPYKTVSIRPVGGVSHRNHSIVYQTEIPFAFDNETRSGDESCCIARLEQNDK